MQRTAVFLTILTIFLLGGTGLPAAAQTAYSVQSDGDDKLYSIDLATGAAKALGATGFKDIESLAFSPGCETLFGIDDVEDVLVQCDLDTGACTAVGKLKVDVTDTGLAVAANGLLYMSTDIPNPPRLYAINSGTGAATLVGEQGFAVTGLAGRPKDLGAECPSGLFGLQGDTPRGAASHLLCFDLSAGVAERVGQLKAVTITDGGLDFDVNGTLYGLTDGNAAGAEPSRIFRVNTETGAAQVVKAVTVNGRPVSGFEGLAIAEGICREVVSERQSVLEVPVLDGWGLAGLALLLAAAGAVALRRRAA